MKKKKHEFNATESTFSSLEMLHVTEHFVVAVDNYTFYTLFDIKC